MDYILRYIVYLEINKPNRFATGVDVKERKCGCRIEISHCPKIKTVRILLHHLYISFSKWEGEFYFIYAKVNVGNYVIIRKQNARI